MQSLPQSQVMSTVKAIVETFVMPGIAWKGNVILSGHYNYNIEWRIAYINIYTRTFNIVKLIDLTNIAYTHHFIARMDDWKALFVSLKSSTRVTLVSLIRVLVWAWERIMLLLNPWVKAGVPLLPLPHAQTLPVTQRSLYANTWHLVHNTQAQGSLLVWGAQAFHLILWLYIQWLYCMSTIIIAVYDHFTIILYLNDNKY